MIDRWALYTLVFLSFITGTAAIYGLAGLVLSDEWLRPLISLLIGGALSTATAFGAWTVNGQLAHSPLPNAGLEREVLSRRQRARLNKARADTLYDRAMEDVIAEQDRLIRNQLERGNS